MGNIQSKRYERLPEEFVGAKVRMRRDLEALGREGKIAWTSLTGGPFADMCMLLSSFLFLVVHFLEGRIRKEKKGKCDCGEETGTWMT